MLMPVRLSTILASCAFSKAAFASFALVVVVVVVAAEAYMYVNLEPVQYDLCNVTPHLRAAQSYLNVHF
jgi:hypothetical protein